MMKEKIYRTETVIWAQEREKKPYILGMFYEVGGDES